MLSEFGKFERVFVFVMDGVGIGEAPDAADYGDQGSHTLKHAMAGRGVLPTFYKLGLYNIDGANMGVGNPEPIAAHMRLMEVSKGKDTTTGHWELMGIELTEPCPTYPDGFPKDFMDELERKCGVGFLGNEAASGTEIIERLGKEHISTGKPIIYTSADSVLQLAAHTDIVPLERLYELCTIARKMSSVGRVIARPFVGEPGSFKRTSDRRDFSLDPPENALDRLSAKGFETVGVGKIEDIFNFRGLTQSYHTTSTASSMEKAAQLADEAFSGLVFVNLIDFDMHYGHRNDVEGFADEMERLDKRFEDFMSHLKDGDCMMITADHGCDPLTESTDHSREYVPLLVYGKGIEPKNLGTKRSFAYVSKAVEAMLEA